MRKKYCLHVVLGKHHSDDCLIFRKSSMKYLYRIKSILTELEITVQTFVCQKSSCSRKKNRACVDMNTWAYCSLSKDSCIHPYICRLGMLTITFFTFLYLFQFILCQFKLPFIMTVQGNTRAFFFFFFIVFWSCHILSSPLSPFLPSKLFHLYACFSGDFSEMWLCNMTVICFICISKATCEFVWIWYSWDIHINTNTYGSHITCFFFCLYFVSISKAFLNHCTG